MAIIAMGNPREIGILAVGFVSDATDVGAAMYIYIYIYTLYGGPWLSEFKP
jgi:hypothetical protein